MDHIVSIQAELCDRQAISTACLRPKRPPPLTCEHRFFSGKVRGLGIQARSWQYPIVGRLESGELTHDNFGSRWGDPRRPDELKQAYAWDQDQGTRRLSGDSDEPPDYLPHLQPDIYRQQCERIHWELQWLEDRLADQPTEMIS